MLSKAIECDPEFIDAYRARGKTCCKLQRWQTAVGDHTRALQLHHKPDPSFYVDRAEACIGAGNYTQAIGDFTFIIANFASDPNLLVFYAQRALAYLGNEKYDLALTDCSKSISMDEDNPLGYCNRGIVYLAMKNEGKAIMDLSKSLEIIKASGEDTIVNGPGGQGRATSDPVAARAWAARARAFLNMGNAQQAVLDCSRALEIMENELDIMYTRGRAYLALRDFEKAIAEFNAYLTADHQNEEILTKRAEALLGLGKHVDAIKDCTAVISKNSSFGLAYRVRATAIIQSGEPSLREKAIEDLSKASELGFR